MSCDILFPPGPLAVQPSYWTVRVWPFASFSVPDHQISVQSLDILDPIGVQFGFAHRLSYALRDAPGQWPLASARSGLRSEPRWLRKHVETTGDQIVIRRCFDVFWELWYWSIAHFHIQNQMNCMNCMNINGGFFTALITGGYLQ